VPKIFILFLALSFVLIGPLMGREQIRGPVEADVLQVRDGDSIDVLAHVWPGHDVRVSIRLRGIDAPELKARCLREKALAIVARERLVELVGEGRVRLTRISGGKYFGRMLAQVETLDGVDVQKLLLREGLVRPYRGRKRKTWCAEAAYRD